MESSCLALLLLLRIEQLGANQKSARRDLVLFGDTFFFPLLLLFPGAAAGKFSTSRLGDVTFFVGAARFFTAFA
jgi:hypothetical protein